jgi:hypothetical protein
MRAAVMLFIVSCFGGAVIGAGVAAVHGAWSYRDSIAWALWIIGSLIVLLVGQSGSPTRMAGEARVLMLGGPFTRGSGIPLPQSPLAFIPIGVLVIAVGVGVYLL